MTVQLKYVIGRRRNDAGEIEYKAAVFNPHHQYHREEFAELQKRVGPLNFFGAAYCELDYEKDEVVRVFSESQGYGTKANERDHEILTKLFKEGKLLEQ